MIDRTKNVIIFLLCLLIFSAPLCASEGKLRSPDTDKRIDSLFVIASSGMVMFRDMVQPAIDSIAAMGESAVPRLIEKYITQDARERQTINSILVKIGKAAVPDIVEGLTLDNAEQVSRLCNTLGEIKDSSAIHGLLGVIWHVDWRVRSEAVGSIGKIGSHRGDEAIIGRLSDSVEIVRKSAAVASGMLLINDALPILVHLLGDTFYGVRLVASEALVKFGPKAIIPIADSLQSENSLLGNLGCTTLGNIGGDSAAVALKTQLHSISPLRRALAVEGLLLCNCPAARVDIELIGKTETDPTVLYFINKVLQKYAP
jgi:HEAT repeat protein